MSDQSKDFHKLCIKNILESRIEQVLNECREISEFTECNRFQAKGNIFSLFPMFETEEAAARVKEHLHFKGYEVYYANTKGKSGRTTNGAASAVHLSKADASKVDFSKEKPYGVCIKCEDKAYFNCERCDDFYCSAQCQKDDWPHHKFNCYPMPSLKPSMIPKNLQSLESSIENVRLNNSNGVSSSQADPAPSTSTNHTKMSQNSTENSTHINGNETACAVNKPVTDSIENNAKVFITYVRDYETVYIRSVATNDAYMNLLTEVASAADNAPNLDSYPCPKRDMVLALYDGFYYRGLVVACNEVTGLVRIGFLDFGNTDDVPFKDLKVLPTELSKRPRLTLIVKLKNTKENPTTEEALAMKEYLERLSDTNEQEIVRVRGDGDRIEKNETVELLEITTNRSIFHGLHK